MVISCTLTILTISYENLIWKVGISGMLRGQIEGCSPALPRSISHSSSCKEQSYFKLNISTLEVSHWKRPFALTCTVKRNGKEMS